MISIVIPLYNKESQITQTLQSVFAQTYPYYEIVIVNDGSTDNSVAKIEKMEDTRIRLIHQHNAGVSAARNKGIEEANYELIAFLDADDEWKPEYLEAQYALYQKYPECSVYASNYEFRNSNGKISPTIIHKIPFQGQDGILNNYFEVASCSHPPLWSSAVMVKKEAMQTINGFPVGITSGEDLITWARLAVSNVIAYNTIVHSTYKTSTTPNGSEPKDLQITKDSVGTILEQLYKKERNHIQKEDIASYISFWYKMKSSINLTLSHRIPAIKCAIKSIKYKSTNYKSYMLLLLAVFPKKIAAFIILKFRK